MTIEILLTYFVKFVLDRIYSVFKFANLALSRANRDLVLVQVGCLLSMLLGKDVVLGASEIEITLQLVELCFQTINLGNIVSLQKHKREGNKFRYTTYLFNAPFFFVLSENRDGLARVL